MHEFYLRLNATEKETYLTAILGDDDESNKASDSDDDDWLPDEILPEILDSDESAVDLGNFHAIKVNFIK